MINGLDIARRLGWDGRRPNHIYLGKLHRVYYVRQADPDKFHEGIAPATKFLNEVTSRLVNVDLESATALVRRWKLLTESPVHVRLWASLSREQKITPPTEVANFLLSSDDVQFWDLYEFPEVAELRALRFKEFDSQEQAKLISRIQKLSPRSLWPKKADSAQVKERRVYVAVRELRRIEVAGAELPKKTRAWMRQRIGVYPNLVAMDRLDEGFPGSSTVQEMKIDPGQDYYGTLVGEVRIKALEADLSNARPGRHGGPGDRATDWIKEPGNLLKVLGDLEATSSSFPRVLNRFVFAHALAVGADGGAAEGDPQQEGLRVLRLFSKLPERTIRQAIDGLSHWLSAWKSQLARLPEGRSAWLKLWPLAVEATNVSPPAEEGLDLGKDIYWGVDEETSTIEGPSRSSPVANLLDFFFEACPSVKEGNRPFEVDDGLRRMRDEISAASGDSGLTGCYRMLEELPYLLKADPEWARDYLLSPLNSDSDEAAKLWLAIARQTQFFNVLRFTGKEMTKRVADSRFDRDTKKSFVFSLVVECLYSFYKKRDPAVPYPDIQQMIRTLDDEEVRAYGAEGVQNFVYDLSTPIQDGQEREAPTPEEIFRSAALPFLQQVWPQECSLTTPVLSQAFANLPATARGEFSNAVKAVEPFLVPFNCWTLASFGFYGETRLEIIDDQWKASALLRLLDLTVGAMDDSVVPGDLSDALDRVREVAPGLTKDRIFRRLETAARRV